jgi:DNA-binding MarR family transcriptional regulator
VIQYDFVDNRRVKATVNSEADVIHALWQLLRRTARAVDKARQRELNRYGISEEQAAVLFTVRRRGRDVTPSMIARELLLEYHSVAEQLVRMEKDGLIRRVRYLDGKSNLQVEMTTKGREYFRKSARRRSTTAIFSALTDEERHQLWALLAKVRDETVRRLDISPTDIYPPSDLLK